MTKTTMWNFTSYEDRNIASLRSNISTDVRRETDVWQVNDKVWGMQAHWPLGLLKLSFTQGNVRDINNKILLTDSLDFSHWAPVSTAHLDSSLGQVLCLPSTAPLLVPTGKSHLIGRTDTLDQWKKGTWIYSSALRTVHDILLCRLLRKSSVSTAQQPRE